MEKLYDTKLVEIDKTGYGPNDIVKSASGTVLVAEKSRSDGGIYGWQAQRLVITSNEPVGSGWYIDDNNLIRKSVTDDADYWAVRKHYKKVEATYPSMREISRIDIADVMKWVKEGCPGSVDLAVNSTIHYPVESHCLGSKPNGVFVYTPILINNTVKMVWVEPYVDERQYLKEEREYNETGYREEEIESEVQEPQVGDRIKSIIKSISHDIYMNCFRGSDEMDYNEQTQEISERILSKLHLLQQPAFPPDAAVPQYEIPEEQTRQPQQVAGETAQVGYMQTVPNSHQFTLYGLQQTLKEFTHQLKGTPDTKTMLSVVEYMLIGIENSIKDNREILPKQHPPIDWEALDEKYCRQEGCAASLKAGHFFKWLKNELNGK